MQTICTILFLKKSNYLELHTFKILISITSRYKEGYKARNTYKVVLNFRMFLLLVITIILLLLCVIKNAEALIMNNMMNL